MDVKDAVHTAKVHILDLFDSEEISNLGLEEVEYDYDSRVWRVTIGFSRPWDTPPNALAAVQQQLAPPRRSYKVVTIKDSTREVQSIKNRET